MKTNGRGAVSGGGSASYKVYVALFKQILKIDSSNILKPKKYNYEK